MRRGAERVFGLVLLASVLASPARALEGRILGSMHHTEDVVTDDILRVLYDVGGYQTFSENVNLHLRMSLNYYSRLNQSNQDLWRGRLFGQMRGRAWLVDAQFSPWQNVYPGGVFGRERDGQLGIRLTPPRLPSLDVRYQRRDRDLGGLKSFNEDKRIQLAYGRDAYGASVWYRQVDTDPGGGIGTTSKMEEYRAEVHGSHAWRRAMVGANWEGLWSEFGQRERRRDLTTQHVNLNANYVPSWRLAFGANALRSWGYVRDNAARQSADVDEAGYGINMLVRATRDLDFRVSREYRRSSAVPRDLVSDYLEGQAQFRRAVKRGLHFQAGYLMVMDLASDRGTLPSNSAYALLDGRLHKGVDGRAEVRAARALGSGRGDLQWHRLLSLRTRPAPPIRFEVEWRKDTLPVLFGLGQEDREWMLLGGYDPTPSTNLVLSWRRLDGTGRVERGEEQWVFTGTQRVGERSQLSLNWSRRNALHPFAFTVSDVMSVDYTFWLPREWQARAMYREDLQGAREFTSYGLSLEKRF